MAGKGGRRATTWTKETRPVSKGRPAIPADLKEAAKQHTQEAVDTTLFWMRQRKSGNAALRAAEGILDRGWGKPQQNTVSVVATVTLEELVGESFKTIEGGQKVIEGKKE